MNIRKADIRYFVKDGFSSTTNEGHTHIKVLPWLSVVQSYEGSYEIALGADGLQSTGEGGFFIAPSGVQQTIVHHTNKDSGRMHCRWLFLDAVFDGERRADSAFHFPTVLPKEARAEMNARFDELFASRDVLEDYACCYRILALLLRYAEENREPPRCSLQAALEYIGEHYAEEICLSRLAECAGMSASNFYAVFKKKFGTSPIAYLNRYRLSLAAELLTKSEDTVGEIGVRVGIPDPLYFSKLFKKTHGLSPRAYREEHKK